jgi:hypothetical protein
MHERNSTERFAAELVFPVANAQKFLATRLMRLETPKAQKVLIVQINDSLYRSEKILRSMFSPDYTGL